MAASIGRLNTSSGQILIRLSCSGISRRALKHPSISSRQHVSSIPNVPRPVKTWTNFKSSSAKFGLRAAIACGVVFTGITYAKSLGFGFGSYEETPIKPCDSDSVESARRAYTAEDASRLKLTLYQYQVCPFCCKLRSFLDFYDIKYHIVEVEPVLRKELKFSNYRKVPILVQEEAKGKIIQMNDSSVIISALTTMMSTDQKDLEQIVTYYPKFTSPKEGFFGREKVEYLNRYNIMLGKPGRSKAEKEEKLWREWVDGVLVHYLPPNIYRTPTEALQAFDYISEMNQYGAIKKIFSKYFGAAGMYFISIRLKKKYHLKNDVRQSLYDASREWMAAVGDREFMGGVQPNLADLAVYGVLSSIEGLDAFNDMVRETTIGPWYHRTKKAVMSHAGSQSQDAV